MKKSLILISIVAIIAGLIVTFSVGLNYDILTKTHDQIKVNIGEEFVSNDVKQIAKEVLGAEVEIQKMGDFEDQVVISSKEIPSEKIEEIVTKINEKYGTEVSATSINVEEIPGANLLDILTPYIWSFIIATILILLYLSIRYKSQGTIIVIAKTIGSIAAVGLLVLSIIALIRIPIGQNTATILFITYALATFGITIYFENTLQKNKLEEQNKE